MIYYLGINLGILMLALISFGFDRKDFTNNKKYNKTSYWLFLVPSFLCLLFVATFRGDFTSDYKNYTALFNYFNMFSFKELLGLNIHQEFGYVFLNKILGLITESIIPFMFISSFIILYAHYNQIKKYSSLIWLSVLLFINIGGYYDSFNMTRQIVSSSIIFLGSKHIYNRNFPKFIIYILVASSFHRTAFIMIPFYFILNVKFNMKRFVVINVMGALTPFYIWHVISFIQKFFYGVYTVESYGMTGLKFTNAVVPVSIMIYVICNKSKIDESNEIENVWINSTLFYTLFSVLGLSIQMLQRLSYLFLPYVLLLIALIVSRVRAKEVRIILIATIVMSLIIFNYVTLSGTGYDPYYFIWNK